MGKIIDICRDIVRGLINAGLIIIGGTVALILIIFAIVAIVFYFVFLIVYLILLYSIILPLSLIINFLIMLLEPFVGGGDEK